MTESENENSGSLFLRQSLTMESVSNKSSSAREDDDKCSSKRWNQLTS